jgi:hypothetical protein
MKKLILILVAVLSLPGAASLAHDRGVYLGIGVGGGSGKFGGGLNLSGQLNGLSLSARLISTQELQFMSTSSPIPSVLDFAVLVGARMQERSASITFEAGPGYVRCTSRGEFLRSEGFIFGHTYYETVHTNAVGLALQSQLYIRGFGVTLYGNVNEAESFAGVLVCFRLGNW